ncbi:hypothetical protein TNCV_3711461 [Trichonephila clavipes]|uniref:ATP-dependent DNA helicase n=1 Tax=Trichonephila clavipes TaxID=2585209 RepID=A0A8X6V1H6_TRICX|nr:hypothetical protein TNCV_3711461 [Trichonephila clavipes]
MALRSGPTTINAKLADAALRKYDKQKFASAGISVTLLNDGQTAHSAFQLPLDIHEKLDAICTTAKKVYWLRYCKGLQL